MLVNFSGLEFIFRFLPVFLILYYLVPETLQDLVLFVGSLVFYASGARWFVLLLLGLVFVNWFFGELVWVMPGKQARPIERRMLAVIVVFVAAVLVLF